jgi:hypothetical protein
MEMKRRGFVGGLAAFFGVGAAGVGVPAVVPEVGEPTTETPRRVGCQVGDTIEIECGGVSCRAVVAGVSMALSVPTMRGSRDGFSMESIPYGPPEIAITLELRSVGEPTMA